MANIVNNLRVNAQEVKKIFYDNKAVKELYFNDILVWKNANPFIFVRNITDGENFNEFGENTLIFEGFGNSFIGSYTIVESAEEEKKNLVKGQMVVETTDGE